MISSQKNMAPPPGVARVSTLRARDTTALPNLQWLKLVPERVLSHTQITWADKAETSVSPRTLSIYSYRKWTSSRESRAHGLSQSSRNTTPYPSIRTAGPGIWDDRMDETIPTLCTCHQHFLHTLRCGGFPARRQKIEKPSDRALIEQADHQRPAKAHAWLFGGCNICMHC